MSHTKQKQIQRRKNEVKVKHWLGINAQQYADNIYKSGLYYLHHVLNLPPQDVALFERQQIFWNWWKSEWDLRNERYFLPQVAQYQNKMELYRTIHDPRNHDSRIADVVLSQSYAEMIGQLQDEIKNQKVCTK